MKILRISYMTLAVVMLLTVNAAAEKFFSILFGFDRSPQVDVRF